MVYIHVGNPTALRIHPDLRNVCDGTCCNVAPTPTCVLHGSWARAVVIDRPSFGPSIPPPAIPVDAAVFVRWIGLADARFGATVSRLDYAIGVCGLHSTTPHIPLHFAISAFSFC